MLMHMQQRIIIRYISCMLWHSHDSAFLYARVQTLMGSAANHIVVLISMETEGICNPEDILCSIEINFVHASDR